jgi:hypothetical protein
MGNLDHRMPPHGVRQAACLCQKDLDVLCPVPNDVPVHPPSPPNPPRSSASCQRLLLDVQSTHVPLESPVPPCLLGTSPLVTYSSHLSAAFYDDSNPWPTPEVRYSVPPRTDNAEAMCDPHLLRSDHVEFQGLENIFSTWRTGHSPSPPTGALISYCERSCCIACKCVYKVERLAYQPQRYDPLPFPLSSNIRSATLTFSVP